MGYRFVSAALAFAALTQGGLACTPNPDPDMRPWKDRVSGSSPMFIGTVVEIRGPGGEVWLDPPECESPGATKECEAFHRGYPASVVFDVEVPINGISDTTFVVEQGRGSDCMVEFGLGQRWLFAGNLNESPSMYLNQSYDWEQAAEARKAGGSKTSERLAPVVSPIIAALPAVDLKAATTILRPGTTIPQSDTTLLPSVKMGGSVTDSTLLVQPGLPAGVGFDPDTPSAKLVAPLVTVSKPAFK